MACERAAGFSYFKRDSNAFIRTSVHKDTTPAQRQAIVNGIHQALIVGIGMPADELFNMVDDYDEQKFFFSRTFNGYQRSDRVVVVEITMRRGRSDAMKRSLYAHIAANLEKMRVWPQRRVHLHARKRLFRLVGGRWQVRHGHCPAGRPRRLILASTDCSLAVAKAAIGTSTFVSIGFFVALRADNLPAR